MSALTLPQLESHLWKATWLLKGPVDAADFKTYIFPLLFFKRISDVHDEEHQAALAESDVLGQAYEYLIKKFADARNKKAGEFYTPRSVVRLMVNILDPREGESIYDPTCGTGGKLLEAIQHVKETRGDVRTLWGKLYGQEKNLTTSAIARIHLFLHGAAEEKLIRLLQENQILLR